MLKKLLFAIFLIASSTQISVAQNCTACFTATPDSITNSVYNLDASCSGSPATGFYNYEWYVDNQYYTTWFFPQFQVPFSTYGTHTITLVLLGQNCSDTSTQTITITPTCNAQFVSYGVGAGGYYFYQNNPSSNTANYYWDFGDGTTQIGSNVGYHTYTATGTYNVCLTLTDTVAGGCADTVCQSVLVNTNLSCIASLYQYVDNFTGLLSADGYNSQYNPMNYGFKFYLNGALVQQGSNGSYYTQLPSIGTYTLSLVVTDNFGSACDSTSQIISYTGGVNNGGCFPCFNASYFNNTYDSIFVDANCSNIPVGGSIAWNVNGVNLTSTSSTQFLGFPTYGTQAITLFIKDSTGAICDSTYSYVYTFSPPCSSCLTVSQVAGSTSDYIFDGSCSSTATSGSVYSWFVDNNLITSTTNSQFTYSFTQSGTYNVCLQIADAFGGACTQSCTSVTVNTPTTTLYDISGKIYKFDNTFAYSSPGNNEAKVYLIKLMTGGQLEAIDSTSTDAFGQYSFSNKPIDDYRIKVALNPNSPDYAYNIPTYFQFGMMWYDAQVVTLFGNTYNKDIYMNYGINSGGNGFISGNVLAGANKKSRSNEDVTLILMDMTTNKPVAYSKTGVNGYYSFSNVPNGTYKVYGELLNRASIPENIVINGTQNSFTGKNFIYNSNVIQPTNIALSIKEETLESKLSIVPNPAIENFTLMNKNYASSINIFDMVGRQIASFELKANEQKNINCAQWTKGMYLIEERVGSKKSIQKLLVK